MEAARARELVDLSRGVPSPRILESQRTLREAKEAKARDVRLEVSELRQLAEAFEAAEVERKQQVVGQVKLEIGPQALQASSSIVMNTAGVDAGSVRRRAVRPRTMPSSTTAACTMCRLFCIID